MIAKNDHVLRFEEQGPKCAHDWQPDETLRLAGKDESPAVCRVARALAKVQDETNPEAWHWYIGMAITWLGEQDDGYTAASVRAADPKSYCDARRPEEK